MVRRLFVILSLIILTSCASANMSDGNKGDQSAVSDPIEGVNRATFEFNYFVDGLLLKPVAALYRDLPPPAVRESFDNFLQNLDSPVNFANGLLQGNLDRAGNTLFRFVVNSTVGVLGLFDVAESWFNTPHREEDFGQTLAAWDLGEGPYVMLPVIGPSNTRDSVGRVVDFFLDPLRYVLLIKNSEQELYTARTVSEAVSARAKTIAPLEDIESSSVDFYASVRSLYKQRRDYLIENREDAQSDAKSKNPSNTTKKPKSSGMLKPESKQPDKKAESKPPINLQLTDGTDGTILDGDKLSYAPKFGSVQ